MKRTTPPKVSPGRMALITHVESLNKHLKGTLSKWSNEKLLAMSHPLDRESLKNNL